MEKEIKEELIKALENLANAATTLSRIWSENEAEIDDAFIDDYPFPDSYDEATVRILDWTEKSTENINNL